jgi:hypothetical protein
MAYLASGSLAHFGFYGEDIPSAVAPVYAAEVAELFPAAYELAADAGDACGFGSGDEGVVSHGSPPGMTNAPTAGVVGAFGVFLRTLKTA